MYLRKKLCAKSLVSHSEVVASQTSLRRMDGEIPDWKVPEVTEFVQTEITAYWISIMTFILHFVEFEMTLNSKSIALEAKREKSYSTLPST